LRDPGVDTRIILTLRLLTGYKMYPGLEFSRTFLAGTEKQSYQFFYLFIAVPLTQHNHHSAHILFFTCGIIFSNPTGPLCTHVSIKCLKYVFCQNLLHKSSNTLELKEGHHEQPYCTAD
jgi:hypothetical protein